ncbi:MAG: hypothetical protein HQK57_00770 [Deltaproteobacteria bacterium]|nr:hypothetical protein [Deltaproteobacteria bacterium]MBF0526063.1 hypothetical protein [Deltaproteobacteria bacterium]
MKRQSLWVMVLLLSLMLTAGTALAMGGGTDPGNGMGQWGCYSGTIGMNTGYEFNIGDNAMMQKFLAETQSIRTTMYQKMRDLSSMFASQTFDLDKAMALQNDINALMVQMNNTRAMYMWQAKQNNHNWMPPGYGMGFWSVEGMYMMF